MSFSIKDLAIKAGAGILTAVFPPAAALIPVVNQFLDDDDKLPQDATGDQVTQALGKLTPEQMVQIESKRIDLQITESNNWAKVQDSLAKADSTGNSTRPQIALMMAWMVVAQVITVCACILYSSFAKDDTALKVLAQYWEMLTASMGVPTLVLLQYFGKRTKEKVERYKQSMGNGNQGLMQTIVGKLVSK